jgi:hydrogenase maturation protein HypF
MKKFEMCVDCAREYCNPANRRFHAEPIACPQCGPQLFLWNSLGEVLAYADAALRQAADDSRRQDRYAKGIGGFQLS